jgi:hypothetical protein
MLVNLFSNSVERFRVFLLPGCQLFNPVFYLNPQEVLPKLPEFAPLIRLVRLLRDITGSKTAARGK